MNMPQGLLSPLPIELPSPDATVGSFEILRLDYVMNMVLFFTNRSLIFLLDYNASGAVSDCILCFIASIHDTFEFH
jgi:hypothetical protein